MSQKAKQALDRSVLQFLGILIVSGFLAAVTVLIFQEKATEWVGVVYFGGILVFMPIYLLGAPGYFGRKYPNDLE